MIRTYSLARFAGGQYAKVPFAANADGGNPSVCISLLAAGDMWGVGAAARNRRELFAAVGVAEARVRSLRQVHSQRVVVAEELARADVNPGESGEEADALVTADHDLVLCVRVADCFPILFFDTAAGCYGAAHSGWRGTGIAREVLTVMKRRFGTRPENIVALVGPGIGSCCYDVPPERAELFRERFGEESVVEREGRHFLDLTAANLRLLGDAGVSDITVISDCTSCSPYLGSFRRQGPDDFVHMLALIGYFG